MGLLVVVCHFGEHRSLVDVLGYKEVQMLLQLKLVLLSVYEEYRCDSSLHNLAATLPQTARLGLALHLLGQQIRRSYFVVQNDLNLGLVDEYVKVILAVAAVALGKSLKKRLEPLLLEEPAFGLEYGGDLEPKNHQIPHLLLDVV